MAKHVKADGSVTDVVPANGTAMELEELQKYVGGYIEVIPSNSPLFILVVNEEGRLAKNPQRNDAANRMASEAGMLGCDNIVGDVLVGTAKELGLDE